MLDYPEWKALSVSFTRYVAATPHFCDVQRLISAYKVAKTDRRSSLSPNTLRDYLHILINMPDLSEFNYYPAVEAWFEEKKRRPSENVPVAGAEWYRGVFPRPNK